MSVQRDSPRTVALGIEHEHLRSLFQDARFGVVFQDSAGAVVEANQAAERILGITLAQMQGRVPVTPGWRVLDEYGAPLPHGMRPPSVVLERGEPI